jgi:5-methylcytosine-specific restriction endonuclease McrA
VTDCVYTDKVLWCSKCKQNKSIALFSKSRTIRRGFQPRCKACNSKIFSSYRIKNRNKLIEKSKKWQRLNRERANENSRKNYQSRREHYKGLHYKWVAANPNKVRKISYQSHLKTRYAGALSPMDLDFAKKHFGFRCAYCFKRRKLEIEHVRPLSRGGARGVSNVVPSCRRCNCSKKKSQWKVWFRSKSFYSKLREKKIVEFLRMRRRANR